jgi:glycosyltransferase involved in cell wall biosynthesis
MRVVMLVQQMDERDWLRAFIVTWVRALAAKIERLDVITLEQGDFRVPENVTVYSMGKEAGKSRVRELWNFHRAMLRVTPKADVIFGHMTPLYNVVAAPYAALFGKRQVLWYAHRGVSLWLKLALGCCWRAVTSMPGSFPIESPKVRTLGQGIDTEFFAPSPCGPRRRPCLEPVPREREILTIIHIGRLMPVKHQATLIRALVQVPNARVVFIGDVPAGLEGYTQYANSLRTLAAKCGVSERVVFTGGLLAGDVRGWCHQADVSVNLSPVGLFDKSALESMACAVPTLVCSRAFDPLLGGDMDLLRLESPEDVDGLARRLRVLLALTPDERARIGSYARQQVVALHSLDQLVTRLVNVFETGESAETAA